MPVAAKSERKSSKLNKGKRAGLVQCYVAGIPFYGYSLGSTFLFAGVLFGLYAFYRARHVYNVQARTS